MVRDMTPEKKAKALVNSLLKTNADILTAEEKASLTIRLTNYELASNVAHKSGIGLINAVDQVMESIRKRS